MMSTREFYFPSGGIRLHCKLDLPGDEAGSRFPLVLVIPGLTGHMEEPHITAIADALPLSGYACLRAELYGHGMSGGSFHDHNLFLWALEIMDLIDYVRKMDADFVVRGIRGASDLESETNLAQINSRLLPGLETVFLPTKPELACVSSSAVREAAFFGADFSSFVPPCILVDVKNHFNKNS